jgi:phage-related tail protein
LLRRQAIANKAAAIIQAGINIAEAVTKALTAGPIVGQVLAGITAAIGGIQLAAIAASPIPGFAKGTDNAPGGYAVVGERGMELVRSPQGSFALTPNKATLVDLPKGSQVIPHEDTMKMLALSGMNNSTQVGISVSMVAEGFKLIKKKASEIRRS